MERHHGICLIFLIGILLVSTAGAREAGGRVTGGARMSTSYYSGEQCSPAHSRGRLFLRVDNAFFIGESADNPIPDCIDPGDYSHNGMEFPRGSNINFGLGIGVMVGGLIGGDTLVAYAGETRPLPGSGEFLFRSTLAPPGPDNDGAIAEVDWVAKGTDTERVDTPPLPYDRGPHKPLHIELITRSYSWSYSYATDFVLFDVTLRNIGTAPIQDVCIGLGTIPDVGFVGSIEPDPGDLTGYLRTFPVGGDCNLLDTVNTMWWADNDGNPINGTFSEKPVPGPGGDIVRSAPDVIGIHLLFPSAVPGPPGSDEPFQCYNWWWQDPFTLETWGPATRENIASGGTSKIGAPASDRDRYFLMVNGEIDYDQAYAASIISV